MKKIIYVYQLVEDKEVFYIGLTKNPEMRLRHHKRNYGEDITMNIFYETWDVEEANRVEKECISDQSLSLDNITRGGGYSARFHKQEKVKSLIVGDAPVPHDREVDTHFPCYYSVIRATHVKNLKDGSYVSISHTNKVVLLYFINRYKFFKERGEEYFDKQEDIAKACATVRKSVHSLFQVLKQCGYLEIKSKNTFNERYNTYRIMEELQFGVLDKHGIVEEFGTRILSQSLAPRPHQGNDEEGLPF